jgi:hypothetical protein
MVAEEWCGLAASVAAPERAAAEPYLLAHGCWLRAQVSRNAPPPLPGGYKVGEKVFFTGTSSTSSGGYKRVHGQQGEVVGPATSSRCEGKGVNVLFPGNTDCLSCYLTAVRRLRAAFAATHRFSDALFQSLQPPTLSKRSRTCRRLESGHAKPQHPAAFGECA